MTYELEVGAGQTREFADVLLADVNRLIATSSVLAKWELMDGAETTVAFTNGTTWTWENRDSCPACVRLRVTNCDNCMTEAFYVTIE